MFHFCYVKVNKDYTEFDNVFHKIRKTIYKLPQKNWYVLFASLILHLPKTQPKSFDLYNTTSQITHVDNT